MQGMTNFVGRFTYLHLKIGVFRTKLIYNSAIGMLGVFKFHICWYFCWYSIILVYAN